MCSPRRWIIELHPLKRVVRTQIQSRRATATGTATNGPALSSWRWDHSRPPREKPHQGRTSQTQRNPPQLHHTLQWKQNLKTFGRKPVSLLPQTKKVFLKDIYKPWGKKPIHLTFKLKTYFPYAAEEIKVHHMWSSKALMLERDACNMQNQRPLII